MARGEQVFEVEVKCVDQEGNAEWQSVVLTLDQDPPEPSVRLDIHTRKGGALEPGVVLHGKFYVITLSEIAGDPEGG